jgi:quinol monooxygenase YgiN
MSGRDGEVVVVATFVAKEGREDEVERALEGLILPSHEEEGCLAYALHRGVDDPRRFAIVERWRSRADLDAHFQLPHVAAVGETVDLLAEPPNILFSRPVPMGDRVKGVLGPESP